ncbi:MAG: HIT family protein, partial [Candidatus Dormibacteraceae bacterium]
TGTRKVYVAQFSEGAGFSHIHFHLVARQPNLTAEERGPFIFRRMVQAAAEDRDLEHIAEAARVADEVRGFLESHRP